MDPSVRWDDVAFFFEKQQSRRQPRPDINSKPLRFRRPAGPQFPWRMLVCLHLVRGWLHRVGWWGGVAPIVRCSFGFFGRNKYALAAWPHIKAGIRARFGYIRTCLPAFTGRLISAMGECHAFNPDVICIDGSIFCRTRTESSKRQKSRATPICSRAAWKN